MEQKHTFHLSVLDITTIGIMTATLEAGKLSLSFLPNIEIVSLLIILYALYLGPKVFFAIYAFVFLEGLLYAHWLYKKVVLSTKKVHYSLIVHFLVSLA